MLLLCVAFAFVFAAGWYLLIAPKLNSYSATIVYAKEDNASKLKKAAFEFCEYQKCDSDLADDEPAASILILYATEYGFAREVARKTAAFLARCHADVGPAVEFPEVDEGAVKLRPRIMNMLDFRAVDFHRESLVLMIVSTTGDGVPPNEAEEFRDAIRDGKVALPKDLKYAVLALGDTGYPHFCRGGALFEDLVQSSVDTPPIIERVNIDQEDWDAILIWAERAYEVSQILSQKENADSPRGIANGTLDTYTDNTDYLDEAISDYANSQDDASVRFSRANPYMATLSARTSLCATTDSEIADSKHVIRVELAVDPDKISYTPGDAVGILPQNNTESVAKLLQMLASNGNEKVVIDGVSDALSLEEALTDRLDLRVIRAELIEELGAIATAKEEKVMAEHLLVRAAGSGSVAAVTLSDEGREYAGERHVIDVLADFPSAQIAVRTFVRYLRPLHARYYSISSSPEKDAGIIAATLDVIRYQKRGVQREGVASTYLNDRIRVGDDVKIFVSKNANFRLPTDATIPIVMIGPGTGIAPFIAFLEEREAANSSGRNVLFFGCRHARQDFLYKKKLQQWAADGFLELMTAFSRDSAEKVYVTHRIKEHGAEVWKSLSQKMAHLYLCGDGNQMAKDVHAALIHVIKMHGGRSDDEAEKFLEQLEAERRYQRDVWVS